MNDDTSTSNNVHELLLASSLNEDCLFEILKYLRVCDLLKICSLDTENDQSLTILIKRILPTKLFDFDEIQTKQHSWSIVQIFKTFGQSMKRIRIALTPITFNHFLRKVTQYCRADKIIELDITIFNEREIFYDLELFERMRPFLQNLQKFNLHNRSDKLNSIFAYYQNNIKLINMLTINGNKLFKVCLDNTPDSLPNIRELRLLNVNYKCINQILDKLPNLEKFICSNYSSHEIINLGMQLLQRYPNLKKIGFILNNFKNVIEYNQRHDFNLDTFGFLNYFPFLTELEMGANDECSGIYKILRHMPYIKSLSMYQIRDIYQEPVEIRRIAQTIKTIIANRNHRFQNNDHVHIIVSMRQYREFTAIKGVDSYIQLSIKQIVRHYYF